MRIRNVCPLFSCGPLRRLRHSPPRVGSSGAGSGSSAPAVQTCNMVLFTNCLCGVCRGQSLYSRLALLARSAFRPPQRHGSSQSITAGVPVWLSPATSRRASGYALFVWTASHQQNPGARQPLSISIPSFQPAKRDAVAARPTAQQRGCGRGGVSIYARRLPQIQGKASSPRFPDRTAYLSTRLSGSTKAVYSAGLTARRGATGLSMHAYRVSSAM